MTFRFVAPLALALACAALAANAQTLYKLVDKNGKVTYSETPPPKHFDGTVTRVDIDPKANTMQAPKAPAKGEAGMTENEKIIRRRPGPSRDDLIRAARARAENACRAFETARDNPTEGDVEWVARGATNPAPPPGVGPRPDPGKAQPPVNNPTLPAGTPPPVGTPPPPPPPPGTPGRPTGARPVPTDDYRARVAQLEKDCGAAREELLRVERGGS